MTCPYQQRIWPHNYSNPSYSQPPPLESAYHNPQPSLAAPQAHAGSAKGGPITLKSSCQWPLDCTVTQLPDGAKVLTFKTATTKADWYQIGYDYRKPDGLYHGYTSSTHVDTHSGEEITGIYKVSLDKTEHSCTYTIVLDPSMEKLKLRLGSGQSVKTYLVDAKSLVPSASQSKPAPPLPSGQLGKSNQPTFPKFPSEQFKAPNLPHYNKPGEKQQKNDPGSPKAVPLTDGMKPPQEKHPTPPPGQKKTPEQPSSPKLPPAPKPAPLEPKPAPEKPAAHKPGADKPGMSEPAAPPSSPNVAPTASFSTSANAVVDALLNHHLTANGSGLTVFGHNASAFVALVDGANVTLVHQQPGGQVQSHSDIQIHQSGRVTLPVQRHTGQLTTPLLIEREVNGQRFTFYAFRADSPGPDQPAQMVIVWGRNFMSTTTPLALPALVRRAYACTVDGTLPLMQSNQNNLTIANRNGFLSPEDQAELASHPPANNRFFVFSNGDVQLSNGSLLYEWRLLDWIRAVQEGRSYFAACVRRADGSIPPSPHGSK